MARTVLLADDSVTAQNMGRRILMDAGYEVITVNNGSAALKKIHENKPDLIVLDVYMPGYGGLEVCQRLKEAPETMKIPVLLTVGKMEPFKAEEAARVRADAHIVKPFDASELLAALTRLEDRIVPSADGRGKNKTATKKARFWHSEDPARNFDDSNTDQIAYLAEVKKRHITGQETEATTSGMATAPAIAAPESQGVPEVAAFTQDAPEAATLAAAPEPIELPVAAAIPTLEFTVEQEPRAEFQADSGIPEGPALPLVADAVSSASVEAPATDTQSRWVAESVALSAEEASLELESEMHAAHAASFGAIASVNEPDAISSSESVPVAEAAGEQFPAPAAEYAVSAAESALSAAAAAGATALGASGSVSSPAGSEAPVASEAVAAWENWQQIRETVMSPQSTAAPAESVGEVVQTVPAHVEESFTPSTEPQVPSETAPQQEADAASLSEGQGGSVELSETDSSSLEGEALSRMVDSVLAELKPKLMQEIARKLKR